MAGDLNLSNLQPAQPRKDRKRVGRGLGSGKGRYSGRGIKGQKSRAGSHAMRAGFEGGQNPLHMRMRKLRGPNKKMSMPFEMFRTHTQHVNLDDLDKRFDDGAAIGLDELRSTGLAKKRDVPVKILGRGELTKKFTVHAHKFSASARSGIEGAGGTLTLLREPKPRKLKNMKRRPEGRTKDTTPETAEATEPAESEE